MGNYIRKVRNEGLGRISGSDGFIRPDLSFCKISHAGYLDSADKMSDFEAMQIVGENLSD